jgi:gliding motility-associated-like protein
LIGNIRFYWEIDGIHPAGNAFTGDLGDFPNIYHTFPKGGLHTIYLKVTNSSVSNTNYAEYSTSITLLPPVSTTKLDFVNLPEYITPNGDSVNDYFEVIATGTTSLSFMVFSRSGSVVYQQEANIIKWDGTNYYGKELPEGIYYFTIEDKGNLYNPAKGFFYIFRGKK